MPDILQDFVFTRVAANASSTDTTITVDDVSQLPTNATLLKGSAWLVFESALTYPPQFEIVQLTNVDSGLHQITVVRAQGGTAAVAHQTGTYLKGALTTDILRRVRSGFVASSVPAADSAVYVVGDRLTNPTTGQQYVYLAAGFMPLTSVPAGGTAGQALVKNSGTDYDIMWSTIAVGSSLPTRATATATTASIAPGATDTTTSMTLSAGYRLYSIQTSRPARVQLYTTAAAKAADAARVIGTDPAADAGVTLDYVTTDTNRHSLSPTVDGESLESTPSSNISMRVTNKDTATGTVTVTFVWLKTE